MEIRMEAGQFTATTKMHSCNVVVVVRTSSRKKERIRLESKIPFQNVKSLFSITCMA
jgi:hypothetical protein